MAALCVVQSRPQPYSNRYSLQLTKHEDTVKIICNNIIIKNLSTYVTWEKVFREAWENSIWVPMPLHIWTNIFKFAFQYPRNTTVKLHNGIKTSKTNKSAL